MKTDPPTARPRPSARHKKAVVRAERAALVRLEHPVDNNSVDARARQRYLNAFTPTTAVARLHAVYADAQSAVPS